jgi:hypothetical protein
MQDAFGVDRESISKGEYSNTIERVQRDRMKANRRRKAGDAAIGGAAIAGSAAALNPIGTMAATERVGDAMGRAGARLSRRGGAAAAYEAGPRPFGGSKSLWIKGNSGKTADAGRRLMSAGYKVANSPGKAALGILGGGLIAGAGLKGAGMAHNARSNKMARDYNKKNKNSKIKVVPVSGKNRF